MREEELSAYEKEQLVIARLKAAEERAKAEELYKRCPWLRETKLPRAKNSFFNFPE